jgi:hypothetical protein
MGRVAGKPEVLESERATKPADKEEARHQAVDEELVPVGTAPSGRLADRVRCLPVRRCRKLAFTRQSNANSTCLQLSFN